jgi:RNA polymerase sigma-70 factor (ECF subfamily)
LSSRLDRVARGLGDCPIGVPIEDFELLEAWRNGDGRAGDALFKRHFLRIYRFFRSKVAGDAEDLTQRTFLALIENKERMREDSNFRTYAFGIARNQLLMHFRKLGYDRERPLESRSAAQLTGDGIETDLRRGEELRLVLAAMRRLPMEFQMALELYYWEDLGINDIAEVLDVAPGTVKSRLWRGRELLRKEIQNSDAPRALRDSTLQELNRWIGALREEVGESGATESPDGGGKRSS